MTVGRAGWCRVTVCDADTGVQVRFDRAPTGRMAVVEVVLARRPAVTADTLRAIPLARLEAWGNGPDGGTLRAEVNARPPAADGGDGAERAAASLRAEWGTGEEAVNDPEAWLCAPDADSLRLDVPEGRFKPAGFYERLADVYSQAAVGTARPAVVVAEANGVDAQQVHRWVKEARRRGILAAGQRGVA